MSSDHDRKGFAAANSCSAHPDRHLMTNDLAGFQAEAIARGYTRDFAFAAKSPPADVAGELRIMEFVTFDNGTDPGDDVTMYLIESQFGPNGYLILSDSFHTDPRKAAFIDAILISRRGTEI